MVSRLLFITTTQQVFRSSCASQFSKNKIYNTSPPAFSFVAVQCIVHVLPSFRTIQYITIRVWLYRSSMHYHPLYIQYFVQCHPVYHHKYNQLPPIQQYNTLPTHYPPPPPLWPTAALATSGTPTVLLHCCLLPALLLDERFFSAPGATED